MNKIILAVAVVLFIGLSALNYHYYGQRNEDASRRASAAVLLGPLYSGVIQSNIARSIAQERDAMIYRELGLGLVLGVGLVLLWRSNAGAIS